MVKQALTRHFLHIGKTGGTALRHALSHAQPDKITFHRHATILPEIPIGEPVIFFLRDPFLRLCSGFFSRQRKGYPRFKSEWTEEETRAFEEFKDPKSLLDAAAGLNGFERRESALFALETIQHVRDRYSKWLVSCKYLQERESDIEYIGFQESLASDFEKIKSLFDLDRSLTLPSSDIDAHRNPTYSIPCLSIETKAFVSDWLREDYQIYQFCMRRHKFLT